MKTGNYEYGVLNPWADVNPRPLSGLSPRVADIAGKTIGLLFNYKLAARPILSVVEEKLKQRYPKIKTKWYITRGAAVSREYLDPEQDAKDPILQDWAKGVDAVIAAVGD